DSARIWSRKNPAEGWDGAEGGDGGDDGDDGNDSVMTGSMTGPADSRLARCAMGRTDRGLSSLARHGEQEGAAVRPDRRGVAAVVAAVGRGRADARGHLAD